MNQVFILLIVLLLLYLLFLQWLHPYLLHRWFTNLLNDSAILLAVSLLLLKGIQLLLLLEIFQSIFLSQLVRDILLHSLIQYWIFLLK